MTDIYKLNFSDCPINYEEFEKKITNRHVSLGILGWFSLKHLRIVPEPKLESIETQLKDAIDFILKNIYTTNKIFGYGFRN